MPVTRSGFQALVDAVWGATSKIVSSVTGAVGSVTGAVGSVTGNVGGNVAGSVGSVTAAVTVGTNNDKTGYSLASAVTVGTNNDKTGYALTAGSYSVRASSSQRGTITVDNTSQTASISSVTTTRATEGHLGGSLNANGGHVYITLTSATVVTATQFADVADATVNSFVVPEFF